MGPIEKLKSNSRLPEYGIPVRIMDKISPAEECSGFFVHPKHIANRRPSENGIYNGYVLKNAVKL